MADPRIVSVRAGRARDWARPEWDRGSERTWRSAYGKDEVGGPVRVTALGIEGDEQFDRSCHGGPRQALLAYAAAHYPLWRAEPGLEALGPGGFGENLVIEGLDERGVCLNDVWASDDAAVRVTQPRGPCMNISRRWNVPGLMQRALETGRVGWYLAVEREGTIERGQRLRLVERPFEGWTIERVFRLKHAPASDPEGVRFLASSAALSPDVREEFRERLARLG